ncbi:unnamed protein product [Microthlaspi erraticum]|uniref:FBD domain-containing protein n=1 Tax=Microthlaspi erraticum TaxID=1685480 RepID=A0A6D2KYD7_9BRAS|nr:unnamed protein product [Microthlaspi erraticum]
MKVKKSEQHPAASSEWFIWLNHPAGASNCTKFTVKVPSLLELTYMNTYFGEDDDDDRSLVIDTPCLIDIDIFDTLGHSCSIEYMPRLIMASVSVELKLVDKFLKCLSSIEYLKLDPVDSTMAPWCNVVYTLLIECRIYPYSSWSGASLGGFAL